ncbi:SAM-dependent methyltransferase [Kribbella sp. ALI-6-A]|uniref:class I SAM-dependent methyltransferase n=1 Tax=Kribbella sp. ALI-6-A TaxID=1933817 RepID=UPI00097C1A25|nr:class I SAM-dependent methyltransferase [Kribbella sp. ALI-6-A]ONI76672.1 SAM-dependent methyltransferase [Kribbella sp. ALI-6-A]
MDWLEWHASYEDEESPLSRRLASVQRAIRQHLDAEPDGRIRVVSACAGQGRDLIEVLATHPARGRVTARLVELDHRNAGLARAAATVNGLTGVEVVEADAGRTDAYAGAVPADLVMFCGVFGNISDADVEATVKALPQFCAPGATVIWTRVREEPNLCPAIRGWFARAGFEELSYDAPDDVLWSVGVNRLTADPQPLETGRQLFSFVRPPDARST